MRIDAIISFPDGDPEDMSVGNVSEVTLPDESTMVIVGGSADGLFSHKVVIRVCEVSSITFYVHPNGEVA